MEKFPEDTPRNRFLFPYTFMALDWTNKQKKKGLVDIKVFRRSRKKITIEQFSKEFMDMVTAPVIEDTDFF